MLFICMELLRSLKSLLIEKKIAELQDMLYITYSIQHTDESKHGQFRKRRHEREEYGQRITDYDILELCKRAKSDITQYIVIGEIMDGVRFIVTQKDSPYLNLVIEPVENSPYDWTLTVVTVMNNEYFKIGSNQLQIVV